MRAILCGFRAGRRSHVAAWWLACGAWLAAAAGWAGAAAGELATRLRRPVALALDADEAWLYVANARAGSISAVELAAGRVRGETVVAGRLADLAAAPGRDYFLALDDASHELLMVRLRGAEAAVARRVPVSAYPARVAASGDGARAYVASLWSRRLTAFDLPASAADAPRARFVTDLPFAPRHVALLERESLVLVADAFGGRLALVDALTGQTRLEREFPAHNIGDALPTPDGRTLLIPHQMLNDLAHTVENDVHWGLVMSNDLRWLRVESVLDAKKHLYHQGHMHPLGESNRAAADPARVALAADGLAVITLAGVGEVALGREGDFRFERLKVGQRPTAVVVAAKARRAYVANTFGDSLSVVDVDAPKTLGEVSLGPRPTPGLVERGEALFHDGRLSLDGWMSCQSCHVDGHTNGQLNDNFSDKSFGAAKRVLSLLGAADTAPFAWNGGTASLEEQIRRSITQTMQDEDEPADDEIAALAAYVRSLQPPPPVDRLRGREDAAAVARGGKLFEQRGCVHCHAPPAYTSPDVYDVGLADKQGNKRFNPPSLRGLSQRGPYFHDNRAGTLEDVLVKHRHQLERPLAEAELADLLAFLRSL